MYKVFINDYSIIIKSKATNFDVDNEVITIENHNKLKDIMDEIFGEKLTSHKILVSSDENELFGMFSSYFKTISAAGGLVRNKNEDVLFIKRLGYWDFPKGKMEKGESPEQTALREVEEETSVKGLQITKKLPSTWHIYKMKEKWILKKTYWFEMKTNVDSILTPQMEEDIQIAEWRKFSDAKGLLNQSYRSLREGFRSYFNY